jgi:hypothetical protein
MVTDTRPQHTQAPPREGDNGCQGASSVQIGNQRRPYTPPQLRSLGKVAELTFKSGSQSETAHTSKPGGAH